MNTPSILRGIARGGAGLAGLGAFGVFAMAASQDHTATATTAAGLCIGLAVLAALDLESFEGLGIKAKLRTTLSDAEARLSSLDTIIRSLSQSAFIQVARGNLTDQERRSAIDELSNALRSGGVSDQLIEKFKLPFYEDIADRLWLMALHIKLYYLTEYYTPDPTKSDQQNSARSNSREEILSKLHRGTSYEGQLREFKSNMEALAANMPVDKNEHLPLMAQSMREIAELFEECRKYGNITDQALYALNNDGDHLGPFAHTILKRFQ